MDERQLENLIAIMHTRPKSQEQACLNFDSPWISSTTNAVTAQGKSIKTLSATSFDISPLRTDDKESKQEMHLVTESTEDQGNHSLTAGSATSGLRPRKYQIGKSSLNIRRQAWQHEEEDLNQILDEERQAWSRRSRKDLRSQYSSVVTVQPTTHKHLNHGNATANTLDEISARRPRKSSFFEGSMNEGSKAIASTWQAPSSIAARDFETSDHSACSDGDSDATPRPSVAGRTSTSSSFDIDDFKPLPPTPSTLKTTIKRLGQKLKSSEARVNLPPEAVDPRVQRSPKKGMRKSMSTWKIFSSSTSDFDNGETSNADDESVKTNETGKSRKKVKAEGKFTTADAHRSILDDRKRKAEVAYAEQFGTIKKRQKDNNGQASISPEPAASEFEIASVRKRAASGSTTIRAMKSALRKVDNDSETETTTESQRRSTATDSASLSMPAVSCHTRSMSQELSLSFDSDTDRRKRQKRQSYTELEKENQHLRLKLRESESQLQLQAHRTLNQPRKSTDCAPIPGPQSTFVKSRSSLDPNWKLHEDQPSIPTRSTSRQDVAQSRNRNSKTGSHFEPSTLSRSGQPIILIRTDEDIPPVPFIPPNLSNRPILVPTTGNVSHARDTATIKRRPPISNNSNIKPEVMFELPRPLSMVLEDVEDEEDSGSGENICAEGKTSSLAKIPGTGPDDAADDKKGSVTGKRKIGQVVEENVAKVQGKWEWPEDVF